eukprot:GHVN01001242.1.p1 GENE.GHVN01001242.1~~GHVN01001242.1.p1  ORF type:complete len:4144 (+),score=533.56 GHVN01001242.1:3-12434(+)
MALMQRRVGSILGIGEAATVVNTGQYPSASTPSMVWGEIKELGASWQYVDIPAGMVKPVVFPQIIAPEREGEEASTMIIPEARFEQGRIKLRVAVPDHRAGECPVNADSVPAEVKPVGVSFLVINEGVYQPPNSMSKVIVQTHSLTLAANEVYKWHTFPQNLRSNPLVIVALQKIDTLRFVHAESAHAYTNKYAVQLLNGFDLKGSGVLELKGRTATIGYMAVEQGETSLNGLSVMSFRTKVTPTIDAARHYFKNTNVYDGTPISYFQLQSRFGSRPFYAWAARVEAKEIIGAAISVNCDPAANDGKHNGDEYFGSLAIQVQRYNTDLPAAKMESEGDGGGSGTISLYAYGTFKATHEWIKVSFSSRIENPVVFVNSISIGDSALSFTVAEVSAITPDGFNVRIRRPAHARNECKDTKSVIEVKEETLNYIAITAGAYTSGAENIYVGKAKVPSGTERKAVTVSLKAKLKGGTAVITTIQEANSERFMFPRVVDPKEESFGLLLSNAYRQEGTNGDAKEAYEVFEATVGYIAVGRDVSSGAFNGLPFSVSHAKWTTKDNGEQHKMAITNVSSSKAIAFAQVGAFNGPDAIVTRISSVGSKEITVQADENRCDTDVAHDEEIYFAVAFDVEAATETPEAEDAHHLQKGHAPACKEDDAACKPLFAYGITSVDHNWKKVVLDKEIENPIVIANAVTVADPRHTLSYVELSEITPTSFMARIRHPSHSGGECDNDKEATVETPPEIFNYIVVKEGIHKLENGQQLVAGKHKIEATPAKYTAQRVELGTTLSEVCSVVYAIQSKNTNKFVLPRVHQRDSKGFSAHLTNAYQRGDKRYEVAWKEYEAELGYLAFAIGKDGVFGGVRLEAQSSGTITTKGNMEIQEFSRTVPTSHTQPLTFADMNYYKGDDATVARIWKTTPEILAISLEEARCGDGRVDHTHGDYAALWTFDTGLQLEPANHTRLGAEPKNKPIFAFGVIEVGAEWRHVQLMSSIVDPVAFATIIEYDGDESYVSTEVRQVTRASFIIRLRLPSHTKGECEANEKSEQPKGKATVNYIVAQMGIHKTEKGGEIEVGIAHAYGGPQKVQLKNTFQSEIVGLFQMQIANTDRYVASRVSRQSPKDITIYVENANNYKEGESKRLGLGGDVGYLVSTVQESTFGGVHFQAQIATFKKGAQWSSSVEFKIAPPSKTAPLTMTALNSFNEGIAAVASLQSVDETKVVVGLERNLCSSDEQKETTAKDEIVCALTLDVESAEGGATMPESADEEDIRVRPRCALYATANRIPCGWDTISKDECNQRGCCFANNVPDKAYHCFLPHQHPGNPRWVTYRGCYQDGVHNVRDLNSIAIDETGMTVARGAQLAYENDPKSFYMGLQNGKGVRYGQAYDINSKSDSKKSDSECNFACSGGTGDKCGGSSRNSIYEFSSPPKEAIKIEDIQSDLTRVGVDEFHFAFPPDGKEKNEVGLCDGMIISTERKAKSKQPIVIKGKKAELLRITPDGKKLMCQDTITHQSVHCGAIGEEGIKDVLILINGCEVYIRTDGVEQWKSMSAFRLHNSDVVSIHNTEGTGISLGGRSACQTSPLCTHTPPVNAPVFVPGGRGNGVEWPNNLIQKAYCCDDRAGGESPIVKWSPNSGKLFNQGVWIDLSHTLTFSSAIHPIVNANPDLFKHDIGSTNLKLQLGGLSVAVEDGQVMCTQGETKVKCGNADHKGRAGRLTVFLDDCYAHIYVDSRLQEGLSVPILDDSGSMVTGSGKIDYRKAEGKIRIAGIPFDFKDGAPMHCKAFHGSGDMRSDRCSSVSTADRTSCGWEGITGEECNSKGCCWSEASGANPCFLPLQNPADRDDYTYKGCFSDCSLTSTKDTYLDLDSRIFNDAKMSSVKMCNEATWSKSPKKSVFAMQNKNECFAGNNYGTTLSEHQTCDMKCGLEPNVNCGGSCANAVYEFNTPPRAPMIRDRYKFEFKKVGESEFEWNHKKTGSLESKPDLGLCNGMKIYTRRAEANDGAISILGKVVGEGATVLLRVTPTADSNEVTCSQSQAGSSNFGEVCGESVTKGKIKDLMIYVFGCRFYLTIDGVKQWEKYHPPSVTDSFPTKITNPGGDSIQLGGVSACFPGPVCGHVEDSQPTVLKTLASPEILAGVRGGPAIATLEHEAICEGMYVEAGHQGFATQDLPSNCNSGTCKGYEGNRRLHLTFGSSAEFQVKVDSDKDMVVCRSITDSQGWVKCGDIPVDGRVDRLGVKFSKCRAIIYVDGYRQIGYEQIIHHDRITEISARGAQFDDNRIVVQGPTECPLKSDKDMGCSATLDMQGNPRCALVTSIPEKQRRLCVFGEESDLKTTCYNRGCCFVDGGCYFPHQHPGDPDDIISKGCWKESKLRELNTKVFQGEPTDLHHGAMNAWKMGPSYDTFSLQNGNQVSAGHIYGMLGKVEMTECKMKCGLTPSQTCGASYRNQIYEFNVPPTKQQKLEIFPYQFREVGEKGEFVWPEPVPPEKKEEVDEKEKPEETRKKLECRLTDEGIEYQGDLNKTDGGKTCQDWNKQTPHEHADFVKNYQEDNQIALNYCRNIDAWQNNAEAPWCYTTDKNQRWEYCSAPFCVAEPYTEEGSELIEIGEFIIASLGTGGVANPNARVLGVNDKGELTMAVIGKGGVKDLASMADKKYLTKVYKRGDEHLFVTNGKKLKFSKTGKDGAHAISVGGADEKVGEGEGDGFTVKTFRDYTPGVDCQVTEVGLEYRGDINVTENGLECLAWKATPPNNYINYGDHPSADGNKCRAFVHGNRHPFCYTEVKNDKNHNKNWGYCHVPRCPTALPFYLTGRLEEGLSVTVNMMNETLKGEPNTQPDWSSLFYLMNLVDSVDQVKSGDVYMIGHRDDKDDGVAIILSTHANYYNTPGTTPMNEVGFLSTKFHARTNSFTATGDEIIWFSHRGLEMAATNDAISGVNVKPNLKLGGSNVRTKNVLEKHGDKKGDWRIKSLLTGKYWSSFHSASGPLSTWLASTGSARHEIYNLMRIYYHSDSILSIGDYVKPSREGHLPQKGEATVAWGDLRVREDWVYVRLSAPIKKGVLVLQQSLQDFSKLIIAEGRIIDDSVIKLRVRQPSHRAGECKNDQSGDAAPLPYHYVNFMVFSEGVHGPETGPQIEVGRVTMERETKSATIKLSKQYDSVPYFFTQVQSINSDKFAFSRIINRSKEGADVILQNAYRAYNLGGSGSEKEYNLESFKEFEGEVGYVAVAGSSGVVDGLAFSAALVSTQHAVNPTAQFHIKDIHGYPLVMARSQTMAGEDEIITSIFRASNERVQVTISEGKCFTGEQEHNAEDVAMVAFDVDDTGDRRDTRVNTHGLAFGLCDGMKLYFEKDGKQNGDIEIFGPEGKALLRIIIKEGDENIYCTDDFGGQHLKHHYVCGKKGDSAGVRHVMVGFFGCAAHLTIDGVNQYPTYKPYMIGSSAATLAKNHKGAKIMLGGVQACSPPARCSFNSANDFTLLPRTGYAVAAGAEAPGDDVTFKFDYICEGTIFHIDQTAKASVNPEDCYYGKMGTCRAPLSDNLMVTFGEQGDLQIKVDPENNQISCKQAPAANAPGLPALGHEWVKCGDLPFSGGVESLSILFDDCLIQLFVNNRKQHGLEIRLNNDHHTQVVVSGSDSERRARISVNAAMNDCGTPRMRCKKQDPHGGFIGCFEVDEFQMPTLHSVEHEGLEKEALLKECQKDCAAYSVLSTPGKGGRCDCHSGVSVGKRAVTEGGDCEGEKNKLLYLMVNRNQGSPLWSHYPIGCFNSGVQEGEDYDLNEYSVTSVEEEVTPPLACAKHCRNYKFFGISDGGLCRCGSTIGTLGSSTQCNERCGTKHPNYKCGSATGIFAYLNVDGALGHLYAKNDAGLTTANNYHRTDLHCGEKNLVLDGPKKGEPARCPVGVFPICDEATGACTAQSAARGVNSFEGLTVINSEYPVSANRLREDGHCGPDYYSDAGLYFAMCDVYSNTPCCSAKKDYVCSEPDLADNKCEGEGDIDMRQYFPSLSFPSLATTTTSTPKPEPPKPRDECEVWYLEYDQDNHYTIPHIDEKGNVSDTLGPITFAECQHLCINRDDCALYTFNLHTKACKLKSDKCRKSDYDTETEKCATEGRSVFADSNAMTPSSDFAVISGPSKCANGLPTALPGLHEALVA